VAYLDRLVGEWLKEKGEAPKDWWKEVVEPLLPRNADAITADLLLDALWGRLSEGARAHARAMTVLRRPAPREVVDALGTVGTAGEFIRAGVVTLFREQSFGEDKKVEWVERWGMHGLVAGFAGRKVTEDEQREAHEAAGAAYEDWVRKPGARWSEQEEGIFHWHAVKEGNRAWPLVEDYVLWLRRRAQYRRALEMLARCEAAGTTGERLAAALMLIAQMRSRLGERSKDVAASLARALDLAESEERRAYVLHEQGDFLDEQGKYGEAEALLREALALKKKALGVEHPSYGASLHALAGVLRAQGKVGEAEALLRKALALVEKALGVEHPSYGASLHNRKTSPSPVLT
jgi:tetratricopeptide (TPR) repeat protein